VRIDRVELSWFRGAAESGILDTNSKSIVVYGANASGKSTFVDGVEYITRNGKICHLQHEYSGSYQEKGVRNTSTPSDENSRSAIFFDVGSSIVADIKSDGSFIISSDPTDLKSTIQSWDVESHLLRQDEVPRFIQYTKGQKYSVLLPLLGLHNLEQAAENLRRLRLNVIEQSEIEVKRVLHQRLIEAAEKSLKSLKEKDVLKELNKQAKKYSIEEPAEQIKPLTEQLTVEIEKRISLLIPEHKRYIIFKQILGENLLTKLEGMITADDKEEQRVDALLDLRISVLEPMERFISIVEDPKKEIQCPSCGQMVAGSDLIEHVTKELELLREVRDVRDEAKNKRKELADALGSVQKKTTDTDFKSWLELPEQEELSVLVDRLTNIQIPEPDVRWKAKNVAALKDILSRSIALLEKEVGRALPSTKKLIDDRDFVQTCSTVPEIHDLQTDIALVQSLVDALEKSGKSVRNEIRRRAEHILGEISVNIRRLWSKIHPEEPIEDIKLYVHSEADKAIDISLKFFGTDQPSPRLTLSEGYRNSLGLSIFLALALFEGGDDPIILDYIVSSLDREHRGMLAKVILEDLAGRQVLLFTHDREWYSELHYRLPAAEWKFMVLRPWESPEIGLQWSESVHTFDDARDLLPDHPEACGNRIRAIMDTHLSITAEKLRIPMQYFRGVRNDYRTCVDFLNRILGEAPKRLKRKVDNSWLPYDDPISDWKTTRDLLIAWADRASHKGSLTQGEEAEKLIDSCEGALNHFRCPSCSDYIWIADQSSRKRLQCSCGELQWRYG
jgi:hypothetical protein